MTGKARGVTAPELVERLTAAAKAGRHPAAGDSVGNVYPVWTCPHGLRFGLYLAGSSVVFTGLCGSRIYGEGRCDDCGDLRRSFRRVFDLIGLRFVEGRSSTAQTDGQSRRT